MPDKESITSFWNDNLCGAHFIDAPYLTKEFFEQYRNFRYNKEHHLNYLIDWSSAKEKSLLEVGVGIGADSYRWAQYCKEFTGIDLTLKAVKTARCHLAEFGLKGNIVKADAENLPFENHTFDIVYSHGVLHHTDNINKAFKEIYRVLKPNGKFIAMLYTKNSFNYWIRIQLYFRMRFLMALLQENFKMQLKSPWKEHLANFHKHGKSYFSWNNWPIHCTDGPNCPISNIYSKFEIKQLLKSSGFKINKMTKAHFPMGIKPMEPFLARFFGFYQFIWAEVNS